LPTPRTNERTSLYVCVLEHPPGPDDDSHPLCSLKAADEGGESDGHNLGGKIGGGGRTYSTHVLLATNSTGSV